MTHVCDGVDARSSLQETLSDRHVAPVHGMVQSGVAALRKVR